jgi:lipopolysaccharide biosynthesis regulator YciM
MLGPAVFLVLLGRRRQRWPGGRCAACGADVGEALYVPRCPSCRAGWAS